MWAFRGVQYQDEAKLAAMDVEALASAKARFGFKKLFRCTGANEFNAAKKLNTRQEGIVKKALSKLKPSERRRDVWVDVAKGWEKPPCCLNATSCVVPNSLPYGLKEKVFLSPLQVCCVQGIWQEDFPALSRYAKKQRCLTRDLAGNAFSSTVCRL